MAQTLRACLLGRREKFPVDFGSRARFREGNSDGAAHHVWQIQRDGPLSDIAGEREGFGQRYGAGESLDTALLADLIGNSPFVRRWNLSADRPVMPRAKS